MVNCINRTVRIGLVGPGLIGKSLLEMINESIGSTTGLPSVDLKVVAICNSRKMLLSTTATETALGVKEVAKINEVGQDKDLTAFVNHLKHGSDISVFVDCTSDQGVADMYPHILSQGVHIATPNKKAFSGDLQLSEDIQNALMVKNSGLLYHEATVGAGLPIINTLKNLLRTGDEITKIEGIFSGTMSYIFNNFSSTSSTDGGGGETKFSQVVSVAKKSGFTEPDPRDDLNGMDVARKTIILARLCGAKLDFNSLSVENIVPQELRSMESAKEFMNSLPQHDDYFNGINKQAKNAGKVLRYVGVYDPKGNNSCVSLKEFDAAHPFANLSGSDNIIAFHTKRYCNSPLIVQGAGAGADVTAGGVFSDILAIVERQVR